MTHERSIRFTTFGGAIVLGLTACTTKSTPNYFPHTESDRFAQVNTLMVAALYNDEEIQFRYEFPTESPSWYHRYLVYHRGQWEPAHSSGIDGAREPNLYEDRISVAIDDGSVAGYDYFGGYLVARAGTRSYPHEVPGDWVESSPLGVRGYGSDVRKYIPDSRSTQSGEGVWHSLRSPEEIAELREQGIFLNTWQWRSHRSNPIGHADHGYVLEFRNSAEGRGMYADNWDEDSGLPAFMYDPERFGFSALRWERLRESGYSQDDPYYLAQEGSVPFDASHPWVEGDVLPATYLREPTGSRGSLVAQGRHDDGAWRVSVTRTREAPNRLDGKSLHPNRQYNIQFAVHTLGMGERYHLVSMPLRFSLGGSGEIVATHVEGNLDAVEVTWTEVPIFYPGLVLLEDLASGPLMRPWREARETPLDPDAVGRFLREVLRHEQTALSGGER